MVRLDLIPPSVQVEAARHRHLRRWTVATLLVFLGFIVSLSMDWARRARASELERHRQQLHTELAAVRAELSSVSQEATHVLEQIERAEALRSKRAWSGMFALIDACMPSGCWLTLVATDPEKGGAQASAKSTPDAGLEITIEAPTRLRLVGYATESSEPLLFVAGLKASNVFANVTLISTQAEPVSDGQYHRFELLCEWS